MKAGQRASARVVRTGFKHVVVASMAMVIVGTSLPAQASDAGAEDANVAQCVQAPVTVGGFTILGSHRVEGISDLKVCVDVNARAGVVPQVIHQPDCGSPCFTIEVRNLDIAADEKIEVTMKRDGIAVPPITFDPDPVNPTAGNQTGRICVIGHGGPPDPCAERITTPKELKVTSGRTKSTLAWGASQDTGDNDLMGYEIWRSTSGAEGTFAHVSTVPSNSAVDQGLTRHQSYWYYVVAFDADGHRSVASNVVTTTTR